MVAGITRWLDGFLGTRESDPSDEYSMPTDFKKPYRRHTSFRCRSQYTFLLASYLTAN
jgi:hypothetical protein